MSPLDSRREQWLPLAALPKYLAQRGFGREVSRKTVLRWASHGCRGARLETLRIGGQTFTTLEAVQRWIDAQQHPRHDPAAEALPANAAVAAPTPEHQASVHLLVEHRVALSPLDRVLATLALPPTTVRFAAGVLFRAGLRTPDDVRRLGLAGVLALNGLGSKSHAVVRALWAQLVG